MPAEAGSTYSGGRNFVSVLQLPPPLDVVRERDRKIYRQHIYSFTCRNCQKEEEEEEEEEVGKERRGTALIGLVARCPPGVRSPPRLPVDILYKLFSCLSALFDYRGLANHIRRPAPPFLLSCYMTCWKLALIETPYYSSFS